MNARDAINHLRSPTGAFVAFCCLFTFALVLLRGFRSPQQAVASQPSNTPMVGTNKPQVMHTVERDIAPFNPPKPAVEAVLSAVGIQPDTEKRSERLLISLYAEAPSATTEPKPLSKQYAPFGRLIPCELVITIDSSSIRTPIVGLVTEDVYHDGWLIIPAGTEVHGSAQTDRTRERIASGNKWTLVWQNGEELSLSGMALDREKNLMGNGWGITDGSAGLRGRLIKSDDLAEVKLFAATFLSGAASALTDREQTILGSIASPALRNAPLKGAQEVLNVYAKQILETIQRDGFYVRVPAGKEFYLYVTQTIDKSDAALGGTRLNMVEDALRNEAVGAPRTESAFPLTKP